MQFSQEDGKCSLVGSYMVSGDTAIVSPEPLVGEPVIGDNFARVGCKCCGNKFVYQCGQCKQFVCYSGEAVKNATCPHCGNVADVPRASGRRIPRTASFDSPYTKWASVNDIPTASRDKFGNPQGSQYDLAQDGSFTKYNVIILNLNHYVNVVEPKAALERKGFVVTVLECTSGMLDRYQLKPLLDKPNSQLWIISDYSLHLSNDVISLIKDYYNSGHGIYIWSDNDPHYVDANAVLKAFYGSVYMAGNYNGDKVLGVQQTRNGPGIIGNHLISTGIVSFYEGITISHLVNYQNVLTPLVYSSDGQVVTAFEDRNGKRVLVDGGFTRLYCNWNTAGTDRFVVNCAAWLANVERFGYQK